MYIDYRSAQKPLPWKGILVEIGFGRGDFTLKLAEENRDKKVLGFELSAISVEKLIKRAKEKGLDNVYCSRIDAYWGFYLLLRDSSVEEIHINYPDPWFKKRHHKRRLTKRENLYIYAKKLVLGGKIFLRTDHFPMVEFTLRESESLRSFEGNLKERNVREPITKYERKWLSAGKRLYELTLTKVREPEDVKIRGIEEVKEVFPTQVEGKRPRPEALRGRKVCLKEGVFLRVFEVYERLGDYVLEVLLSEKGFVQKFFISIRKKGERGYVVDVSPFSEVLRTEGIRAAVEFIASEGFTPSSR